MGFLNVGSILDLGLLRSFIMFKSCHRNIQAQADWICIIREKPNSSGGQYPKNPIFESFGSSWLAWSVNLTQAIYQKRVIEEPGPPRTPDFMDKAIKTQKKVPNIVHDVTIMR